MKSRGLLWWCRPMLIVLTLSAPATTQVPTLTVQGPLRVDPAPSRREQERDLRRVRLAGSAAAGGGVGLLVYAAVAATGGPVTLGATLVFAGGLSAYLAHRALHGHDDLFPAVRPIDLPRPEIEIQERPKEPGVVRLPSAAEHPAAISVEPDAGAS